ncbi:MAG: acyl-CoA dehydrogenase family protein [Ilumatobacteraceae bacterium]
MEYELGDDEQAFQETTRKFLEAESPLTEVRRLSETESGFDPAWWRHGAELGWTSLLVSEEDGGAGLGTDGIRYLALVAEEVGRLVSPGPLAPTNVVAAMLSRSGSDEQRGAWLEGLVAGTTIGAWAVAPSKKTGDLTATAAGDGVVLSGTARAVEAAAEADVLLVTALGASGPVNVVLPAGTGGVTVERQGGLDLVRRYGNVTFADVEVGAEAIVGAGSAGEDADFALAVALALQAVESAGAADRVLEFTLEYMNDRYSFGRPLSSYQALKHRFADMKLWLEASHATADAAVRELSEGTDGLHLARVAKIYTGDFLPELVQDCVQMHGGIGVTWEHDIHLYLRRIASNRFVLGDPAAHRDALAANLLATL